MMVMQLGPTSSKRIVLSYFLPRGLGIFLHHGHYFINVSYLQRTGKFEVQEAESLNVLNKNPFKDSYSRSIQHN